MQGKIPKQLDQILHGVYTTRKNAMKTDVATIQAKDGPFKSTPGKKTAQVPDLKVPLLQTTQRIERLEI